MGDYHATWVYSNNPTRPCASSEQDSLFRKIQSRGIQPETGSQKHPRNGLRELVSSAVLLRIHSYSFVVKAEVPALAN